ncbi:MAG TPA: allantoicase, partial [Thermoanaerobaculia bacterium]|nr:allantoicase [Thermoanaerobaculia bacterium]
MADFRELIDLASERLGGAVLYATDDFFAEKENLLKQAKPVWKEHEYTDRGKWMDGWESRRKRTPGHDHAIIRLGAPGVIRGFVVDTSFFRGNYPSHCSIEACYAPFESRPDELTSWVEILPKSELRGDSENELAIESPFAFTHLRFHIYPDGGVARLRVHGEVVPEWRRSGGLSNQIDLAAIEHGGEVLTCSDMFFGPKHNLIMPGRAFNMSDGWETRRRRGPGHDWVIV